MFDPAVRKGRGSVNVFQNAKLDKITGRKWLSHIPFTTAKLKELLSQDMPEHLRRIQSILAGTWVPHFEAALLNWENAKRDADQGVDYFDLTEAILKNTGSGRRVPMASKLDWFVTGQIGQMRTEFTRDLDGKAEVSAWKAFMPLVRSVTDDPQKVFHSLRGRT